MPVVLRLVKFLADQAVRHKFQIDEIALIIVGIFVTVTVAKLLHQFRRGVPKVERDSRTLRFLRQFKSLIYSHISRVAFCTACKVYRTFRERNPGLGHTYVMHYVKAGIGKKQGIGIGQPYILRSRNAESARNEERVFAGIQHTGQIIDGRIRVRTSDALDESRNYIVMHLAALVIQGHILLQAGLHAFVADDYRARRRCIHDYFEYVQQFARIPAAVTEERLAAFHPYLPVLQDHVLPDGPRKQFFQIFLVQRLQDKDLAA